MTREEAIRELKEDIELYIPLRGTIDDVDRDLPDGRLITALEMAIKALEQFETVTEFADRCRECGARYGKLLKQASCKDITPATPEYQKAYMQGWDDGRRDLIEKIKREFKI